MAQHLLSRKQNYPALNADDFDRIPTEHVYQQHLKKRAH